MVRALHGIVPFTSLAVYEADHEARELVPVFAVGRYVEETLADRPPFDASIAGGVVKTGKMAHLAPDDPRQGPYTIPDTPQDEPAGIVVTPLFVGEHVLGTMNVWREAEEAQSFSEDEAGLIRRFATLAALAYANARQRERLSLQALTDELTGLANRRHFLDRLASELARSEREGAPVALVLVDLDDFKAINDRHGHPAGDDALRGFAAVLRAQTRASDLACRTGGEEFAIILPRTGHASAVGYAQRILKATHEAGIGPAGRLTASAGVAVAPEDSRDQAELFSLADDRLLRAKALGKDRVVDG